MSVATETETQTPTINDTTTDTDTPRKRSGGPRTAEGKERSRRNALKHGMRAEVVLPVDIEIEVAARREELAAEMQPRPGHESFLVDQIALAEVRIRRLETLQAEDERRRAMRARVVWNADRCAAAAILGNKLANDPPKYIWMLRRTLQGAGWLMERWLGLAEALRRNGCWNEDQWILAHNLKGVPKTLRGCDSGLPASPEETADDDELIDLVEEEIQTLEDDCDAVLNNLDDNERAMTALGMPLDEDAPTARLRRYETSVRRDLRWAFAELHRARAASEPAASPPTKAPAPPTPSPRHDGDALARSTAALAQDEAFWADFNAKIRDRKPSPADANALPAASMVPISVGRPPR